MTIKTSKYNNRNIALSIIDKIVREGHHSHIALNDELNKYQELTKQERAFITRIVEGTLEQLIFIDYIIDKYSKVKTNKIKPTILNILRISIYQIKFMESVPVSSACDEGVKLARKRGFHNLTGFVNGVLRNVGREINNIELPSEKEDKIKYLSIKHSFPEWIIRMWLLQYNYETVEEICKSSNMIANTSVRCNITKITPEELKKTLIENNVIIRESKIFNYAFELLEYDKLNKLSTFNNGFFTVQDVSSMLVAEIASPKENDLIIDVCAAPGGKSTHIAEKIHPSGIIISRDVSDKKINMINENVKRLNLQNITVEKHDALKLDEAMINKADIVLADVPCSGLGIIRKKPDIKFHLKEKQIEELIVLQRNILKIVKEYVKINGILIYSTCTINQKENQDNIRWFTENFPFQLEDINTYIPNELKIGLIGEKMIQLLPHQCTTDGFFIARLRRMK